MLVLTDLMRHSLDEGYAEAAARRPAGSRSRPTWLLAGGLLAVGLLLATAAAQTRDRAPVAAQARTALVEEIGERTALTDRLQGEVTRLRVSVARTQRDNLRLTASGTALAEQLVVLEAATGAAAVVGPALAVHLQDAADTGADKGAGDPRADQDRSDGRVSDRDLQTVVNELWAVGAEAVAVNGQRLTSLSAIRAAGDAVLVDFRPIKPPYDVVAVGDAPAMQRRLVDGFGGSYLQVLRNYGITWSVKTRDRVRLPASGSTTLRWATAPEPGAGRAAPQASTSTAASTSASTSASPSAEGAR